MKREACTAEEIKEILEEEGLLAVIQTDETCSIRPTKNGEKLMAMTWFVPFFGSVSPAYLSYVICHWHDKV